MTDLYVFDNEVRNRTETGDVVVGIFSGHWPAVAAMIRTTQPDFKSIGGDKPADLAEEAHMATCLVKPASTPKPPAAATLAAGPLTAPSGRDTPPTGLRLARHALGLPNDLNVSYRNRFVAVIGTPDHADWLAMVEQGAAIMIPNHSPAVDYFYLTRQSALAVLSPAERLDDEDFS